jgi:hypothetical protein
MPQKGIDRHGGRRRTPGSPPRSAPRRPAYAESNASLRSYLKKLAVETWTYVNWLTHAKNAIGMDAEIGLKAVEHLLGTFTAARMRLGRRSLRCESCGSYQMVAGTCDRCGSADSDYEPSATRQR